MVQYFAENLDGFAVTQNGWVQSYGSRCTRPSILWGDVSRPEADHGRVVVVHAVADREAGQGHAHRPGDDPRVVVRPRRPAARRHRQPGRPRPARRDRRPRGRRHRRHPGGRARAARAAAPARRGPRRVPRLVGPLVPPVDRRRPRGHADPHAPVLLGVRRDHRRDRRPRRRRHVHRGGPLEDGDPRRHLGGRLPARRSARASTTSTRRASPARPRSRSCSPRRSRPSRSTSSGSTRTAA